MKRIALVTVCLVAAVATWYAARPDLIEQHIEAATKAVLQVRDKIEANAIPVLLALGTFLLTVIFHKARGKSLRESVEVAATRVTVVTVPTKEPGEDENPMVKRANARATRTQLLTDQIGLQIRYRKLPEEVKKAEKEACYTEQAVADARKSLTAKEKAHDEAAAKLKAIRKEKADCGEELAEIEDALQQLAELV